MKFSVNGKPVEFDGDGDMPLLWYLRDQLHLKGTKFGCGIGSCGACTVHVDGQATRSCVTPMDAVEDTHISTIESLATEELHPVQRAWVEEDVAQCGYCQSGQIMAAVAFLRDTPDPTDDDIDNSIDNLCRCGSYTRIRKAIHKAAKTMREEA